MIADNLAVIQTNIAAAAARSGRSNSAVSLVAVSKHQDVAAMKAYAELIDKQGQLPLFGESYVQEYATKKRLLNCKHCSRLIGPLQSNKVARAVELFDLIESVHSLKIAQLVSQHALKLSKRQAIYLQVNISQDQDKQGFNPSEIEDLIKDHIFNLAGIDLRGLMTITKLYPEPEGARQDFRALRNLADNLQTKIPKMPSLALSMGMSADYEIAIEEGATHVRIGTALFGERS